MFKISLTFSFSTSTPTTHPSRRSSWYPTHVTSFWKPLSALLCRELRTLLKSPNFARVSNITLNLYEVGTRRSRVLWIAVKLVVPPAVKTRSMFLKMKSRDLSVWNNGQKIQGPSIGRYWHVYPLRNLSCSHRSANYPDKKRKPQNEGYATHGLSVAPAGKARHTAWSLSAWVYHDWHERRSRDFEGH